MLPSKALPGRLSRVRRTVATAASALFLWGELFALFRGDGFLFSVMPRRILQQMYTESIGQKYGMCCCTIVLCASKGRPTQRKGFS